LQEGGTSALESGLSLASDLNMAGSANDNPPSQIALALFAQKSGGDRFSLR
jgi:hypothetical protein